MSAEDASEGEAGGVPQPTYLHGGVSGVELGIDSFDLSEGVEIRRTYAHLFSANMMAFARPKSANSPHPAPWKAAKGGYSFDIEAEVRVPAASDVSHGLDAKETIWWIAALLRLHSVPYLSVPVISDRSFREIATSNSEATLTPFETSPRIVQRPKSRSPTIDESELEWVREKWVSGARLLKRNPKFFAAIKAFDSATINGRPSSSLLALWGGLEQLFAPSVGELRFRVAALLASYLHAPGDKRLECYKNVLKLYNERSTAAHTALEIESGSIIGTYVLMRNALVKMIDENSIPTQSDLESLLFTQSQPPC